MAFKISTWEGKRSYDFRRGSMHGIKSHMIDESRATHWLVAWGKDLLQERHWTSNSVEESPGRSRTWFKREKQCVEICVNPSDQNSQIIQKG